MAQQAQVSEEQARALAEESRESGWDKPSLAKELFLGRFPLELIHPFPRPSYQEAARAEKFLAQLREFLDSVDGSVIERDAQIPDEYVKGLAELGAESRSEGGNVFIPKSNLVGKEIFLGGKFGSTVLGTDNVMMAAVLAVFASRQEAATTLTVRQQLSDGRPLEGSTR